MRGNGAIDQPLADDEFAAAELAGVEPRHCGGQHAAIAVAAAMLVLDELEDRLLAQATDLGAAWPHPPEFEDGSGIGVGMRGAASSYRAWRASFRWKHVGSPVDAFVHDRG